MADSVSYTICARIDTGNEAMVTHLAGMVLPAESNLDINIRVTQPLNITSFSARQKVTQFVIQELSSQLGGETPELTVVFTLPGKGVLGRVGTLRVDARTGELLCDPQTLQEMMRHVEQLARSASLPTGA
jgi:hypothetical protein